MIELIHGPNKHKAQKIFNALQKKHESFALFVFDCSSLDVINEIEKTLTLQGLFDTGQKLLYVKNFQALEEYTIDIAKRYNKDTNILIIFQSDEKVRSNAKVLKLFEKHLIHEASAYSLEELHSLLEKKLQENDIQNAFSITQKLLEYVEHDPYFLEHEADKIILYSKTHEISSLAIDSLISKSMKYTIWKYLRAVTEGQKKQAVGILTDMLEKGENEYGILAMLTWNLRLLTVIALADRRNDASIAHDFGYSPYAIKNARKLLSKFPVTKITLIYEKIIDLDYKIKSGLVEPRLGLILLSYIF